MKEILNISVFSMLSEYKKNKDLIHSYLNKKENYCGSGMGYVMADPAPNPPVVVPVGPTPAPVVPVVEHPDEAKILGLTIGAFVAIFLIFVILWLWAFVMLIQKWNNLNMVVKVVSLLLLFLLHIAGPLTPLLVIILIKLTEKQF